MDVVVSCLLHVQWVEPLLGLFLLLLFSLEYLFFGSLLSLLLEGVDYVLLPSKGGISVCKRCLFENFFLALDRSFLHLFKLLKPVKLLAYFEILSLFLLFFLLFFLFDVLPDLVSHVEKYEQDREAAEDVEPNGRQVLWPSPCGMGLLLYLLLLKLEALLMQGKLRIITIDHFFLYPRSTADDEPLVIRGIHFLL